MITKSEKLLINTTTNNIILDYIHPEQNFGYDETKLETEYLVVRKEDIKILLKDFATYFTKFYTSSKITDKIIEKYIEEKINL